MKFALCLAPILALSVPICHDEPKVFLVIQGAATQTVVDLAAQQAEPEACQRTIAALPEPGLVAWNWSRRVDAQEVAGSGGRAVFVRDLLVRDPPPPYQATPPARALELIGWLGDSNRVVVQDRQIPAGYMLRLVPARLAKDSMRDAAVDLTAEPGVYKYAVVTRRGNLAWFRVRGADRGQVCVWRDGAVRVVAEDVGASQLCWSPDDSRLAVAELGKLTILDPSGMAKPVVHTLPPGCKGLPARIGSMLWRPDGGALVLLPDWPEPDHLPGNPRVWSLDPGTGACEVLVNLVEPAVGLRWLDGTGCTTSLEEACVLAARPVVGCRL